MKAILLALTCVVVLCGCKPGKENGEGGNDSFSDGEATGRVHMQNFTVQSGRTRVHPMDNSKWLIELYDEAFTDPCNVFSQPEYYINFSTVKLVGSYAITMMNSVSFARTITNGVQVNVATTGALQIDQIQDGFVVGKILSEIDSDNHINGSFWAKICN